MSSQVVSKPIMAVYGDKTAPGTVEVLYFGKEARMARALKTTLICLCVALVCLCIPGAHFVLVPLTLLATPFVVTRAYRVSSSVVSISAPCAACGGALTSLSAREVYPLLENCVSCQRENRIVPT